MPKSSGTIFLCLGVRFGRGVAIWAVSMARPKRSNDWGFPALARLRRGARRRTGAPLRPPRLRGARRPAGAEIAEQPRALVFLRAPRRRVQSQLELFRRADRRGRRRARIGRARAAPTPSARPTIMAGAAPATAAAAATRCARSTCSSWRPTPVSRRSRPPSAASPRPTIPMSSPATRKRPRASR